MAENENKDQSEETADAEAPKKSRKGLFMGGGIVGLVAAAYAVSLVAVPTVPTDPPFEGPFVTALTPGEIQVNLKGEGSKRYMVATLKAEYDAYDDLYAKARVADPLYQAKLRDILIRIGRQKTREDIDHAIGEEVFKEEVREAVDPLLFPLHIGNPEPGKHDEESGLRLGDSVDDSTLRGGFHSHMLHLDAARGTIALDNGIPVSFAGDETDLVVTNENGKTVHVDVTQLDRDFVGDVEVGRFGRIREVLLDKFLIQ